MPQSDLDAFDALVLEISQKFREMSDLMGQAVVLWVKIRVMVAMKKEPS